MSKSLSIPELEQLQALSGGLKEVYQLLAKYLGDLNTSPNFLLHITVTKKQLSHYLRLHPDLAERHVSKPSDPKYEESPVLERSGRKYRVYEVNHGEALYTVEFDDLADAAAEYLMWGW